MSKKLKCRARKFGVKTELADQKLAPKTGRTKTGPCQIWLSKNWPDLKLAQSQNWANPKTVPNLT